MNRRRFLSLAGAMLAAPLAEAQPLPVGEQRAAHHVDQRSTRG